MWHERRESQHSGAEQSRAEGAQGGAALRRQLFYFALRFLCKKLAQMRQTMSALMRAAPCGCRRKASGGGAGRVACGMPSFVG